MFSLKKIAAMVCAVAMTATMCVLPASADGASATVGNGILEPTAAGHTFITISSDYFKDNYTIAGTLMYKVTKGVFSRAINVAWGDEQGLWNGDMWAGPTMDVQFATTYSDDYDLITISWAGSYAYKTSDGKIAQIRLIYADTTNKGDAIITPVSSSEDSAVQFDLCDASGAVTASGQAFVADTNTYSLASGTNVVTVVEEEEPTPAATATVVGDYTGDKETEGDEADTTDKAVAILGTPVAPESQATSLVWTVTPNTGDAQQFTQVVDVEGGATYKFGLVLRNITEDLIKTVSAVLQ